MKTTLITALLFTFLVTSLPQNAWSQSYFTGSFELAVWDEVDGDARIMMNMVVSPERMRVSGVSNTGLANRASGPMAQAFSNDQMLFRLDMQDIVVMTSETTALQIRQAEIQAMINLMSGFSRGSSGSSGSSGAASSTTSSTTDSNITITETNETRRIQGFTARKFVLVDADSPEAVAHVWVSESFRVNWGMLLDIPGLLTDWVPVGQVTELFRGGQTPLLLEIFENGVLTSRIGMVNVRQGADTSLFEVPAGVRLMTLQDMILQQMRQY
jgi:hypothetical protein